MEYLQERNNTAGLNVTETQAGRTVQSFPSINKHVENNNFIWIGSSENPGPGLSGVFFYP